ncbi:MAG: D-alanyl-D-alanine carboxypeptidase/D-alanyl-D-alanine-endopeptidase [Bacteroidetes bacterium]|nr:MAG: D-alanyl-D-alanine carboxypeptidase/D-alanyl-D-alanine-endopeptidase [Bacteroidota bacterium]
MLRIIFIISFGYISLSSFSQDRSVEIFLSDTALIHASVSLCIANAETGDIIKEYNSEKSLIPASIMKLVTSAAAIELLGPEYTFKTLIGYSGSLNKRSGKLKGDIVISGGGDPALGSQYFSDYYRNFMTNWVEEVRKVGIKKIAGRVITDDSYYDFQPVPGKWLWEDAGNYYGAGAYGLSVFDNTYEIHLKTSSDSSRPVIKAIVPSEYLPELTNFLVTADSSGVGYVFAAPYSRKGWLAGTIPADQEDFVLKASVADPPLLLATIINDKLEAAGISISGTPTTVRLEQKSLSREVFPITETISPPLADIIGVLNHESVNLFAEHLTKELGKKYKNSGSIASGIEVVTSFLQNAGIKTDGMFMEDGSGLSPQNAINAGELVRLLNYMEIRGKYFPEYIASLPDAGKNGTLKNYFTDPVFDSNLKAKSGSMTRVRSYAGYFTAKSGKKMTFSIIINNYTGPSKNIITGIEEIIKETILNK